MPDGHGRTSTRLKSGARDLANGRLPRLPLRRMSTGADVDSRFQRPLHKWSPSHAQAPEHPHPSPLPSREREPDLPSNRHWRGFAKVSFRGNDGGASPHPGPLPKGEGVGAGVPAPPRGRGSRSRNDGGLRQGFIHGRGRPNSGGEPRRGNCYARRMELERRRRGGAEHFRSRLRGRARRGDASGGLCPPRGRVPAADGGWGAQHARRAAFRSHAELRAGRGGSRVAGRGLFRHPRVVGASARGAAHAAYRRRGGSRFGPGTVLLRREQPGHARSRRARGGADRARVRRYRPRHHRGARVPGSH